MRWGLPSRHAEGIVDHSGRAVTHLKRHGHRVGDGLAERVVRLVPRDRDAVATGGEHAGAVCEHRAHLPRCQVEIDRARHRRQLHLVEPLEPKLWHWQPVKHSCATSAACVLAVDSVVIA